MTASSTSFVFSRITYEVLEERAIIDSTREYKVDFCNYIRNLI
jgi:hypothetical protein